MRLGEPDMTSDAIVCWNRIKQVDRWIPHGRSVRVIVLGLVPEAGMYILRTHELWRLHRG